ncbi:condensation domain-containing protein [Mycobacterium sp. URHB0021]|jgi:condensation domain-containing protein
MSVLTEQSTLIRPIGSLERLFFRYSERHPAHFLLAAEFDGILDDEQLRSALDSVQQRHPLLSVHVEDHPSTRLGFYRAPATAPIPLTVHHGRSDWQPLAAAELAMPFDRSVAPLLRATLATTPSASVVILTFDHTIADGISAVHVLDDLIAALNGRQLVNLPVPPAIEDLIDLSLEGTATTVIPEPDERMAEPTTQRPFDGSAPFLHTVAMTEADTARLAVRCRAERTTVHAAILVAAFRVRGQQLGDAFVRALSPIDIRELTHAGTDCAAYFTGTCTGLQPDDGRSFWDQARAMSADLDVARSAFGVIAGSQAIRQAVPADATADNAEQVFGNAFAWELLTTNLGRQDLTDTGPIAPSAIWAPIVQSHMTDEYVLSIITYRGRLRMACTGYAPTADYAQAVVDTLVTESKQRRAS